MLQRSDCYKNYFQYKRICPDLDRSYVFKDQQTLSTLSDADVQKLYTETIREYASLQSCEIKRTFVYEQCYDDKDEGHRLAIENVRKQKTECLQTLTILSSELERRRGKLPNSPLDSDETDIQSKGKNAKKNAKKRRQKVFQKTLENDDVYRQSWREIEDELERVEASQTLVFSQLLQRVEELMNANVADTRYRFLYERLVTQPSTEFVAKIYFLRHSRSTTIQYVTLSDARKIDMSEITAVDIERWINHIIDGLRLSSEILDEILEEFAGALEYFDWSTAEKQLGLTLAEKLIRKWFDVGGSHMFNTEQHILNVGFAVLICPILFTMVIPNRWSALENDLQRRRYLLKFNQLRDDIEVNIQRMYTSSCKEFGLPICDKKQIDYTDFNGLFKTDTFLLKSERGYVDEDEKRRIIINILGRVEASD